MFSSLTYAYKERFLSASWDAGWTHLSAQKVWRQALLLSGTKIMK